MNPDTGYTIQDARASSLQRRWKDKAYERAAAFYSQAVADQLGPRRQLDQIDSQLVESMVAAFLERGDAPSTINRKCSALWAMLADAAAQDWIKRVPAMPARQKPRAQARQQGA